MKKLIIPSYFVGVNIGTVGLFWYDKKRAIEKKWRLNK
jgi:uncharacterized membrane protein YsdA (DUF1294 family)